jgi:hypothetical protein
MFQIGVTLRKRCLKYAKNAAKMPSWGNATALATNSLRPSRFFTSFSMF